MQSSDIAAGTPGQNTQGVSSSRHQKFLKGPIMMHVIIMTLSGAMGLVAIFFVDLINLMYIQWLGDEKKTAAVGFASTVLFFSVSFGVGVMIAATALVSRTIGAGKLERARELASASMIVMAVSTLCLSIVLYIFASPLLFWLGARDETLVFATRYLRFVLTMTVPLCLGIGLSGILRAVGDAKRSMFVTLSGAVVTFVLDPLFILVLRLELDGAAFVACLSRLVILFVGIHGVWRIHKMLAVPRLRRLPGDVVEVIHIAFPAVLTNIATPVAVFILQHYMAAYGDSAIAGFAVVDRIVPVALGMLFALSASVSPIIGQNFGAGDFVRVNRTMGDAALFTVLYVLTIWAALFASREIIVSVFALEGLAAELVRLFCTWMVPGFGFLGFLFIGNSAFNTLGYPLFSTAINWARALIGVWPLILIGGYFYGPQGLMMGFASASVVFGGVSLALGFHVIGALAGQRQGERRRGYGTILITPGAAKTLTKTENQVVDPTYSLPLSSLSATKRC